MTTSLIAALLSLVAAAAPLKSVWVSHTFVGGPKCVGAGPVSHFTPPGFEAERLRLQKLGITVIREYFRDEATCEACHRCPNYSREIFFEIEEKYLPHADKAGYRRPTAAPDADELLQFENNKRFRPKPDRPDED